METRSKIMWAKYLAIVVALSVAGIFLHRYRVDVAFDVSVRKRQPIHNVAVGDVVQIGTHLGEPITWKVIHETGSRKLLLTENGIEIKQYHDQFEDVTWEGSNIRKWLNRNFYEGSFSEAEKAGILLSDMMNCNNEKYGTLGGRDTKDRVFLLSIDEAKKYFPNNESRICQPSKNVLNNALCYVTWEEAAKYEKKTLEQKYTEMVTLEWFNNVYSDIDKFRTNAKNSWWLLRSPGCDGKSAAVVHSDGSIDYTGGYVTNPDEVVRPAMWVDVNKF